MFFSYMLPYAIIEKQTFTMLPINFDEWLILGPVWLPKTKCLLFFAIFLLGVTISNSDKLFKYTLSSQNKLSETYIYKIIESTIIYILLSTLNEKTQIHTEHVLEFLHSLLFLLLMISSSMAVIGVFNKLCAKKSNLLTYFSKYNYFIYATNILPVLLLEKSLNSYSYLLGVQKIYIITLFSITLCYGVGLFIRRLPYIRWLIPTKSFTKI